MSVALSWEIVTFIIVMIIGVWKFDDGNVEYSSSKLM